MNKNYAKVNGTDIYYYDTGGGRPPMLCLHGRWGRGRTWTNLISRYKARYRIITPDQRGHGKSSKPDTNYSGEDFANDAYELLKILDCGKTVVIGHSMGGMNGAFLAALYPGVVKSLVIIDSKASGPEKSTIKMSESITQVDELTKDWPLPYSSRENAEKDLKKRFNYKSNVEYFLDSLKKTADGYSFMFNSRAMALIAANSRNWYDILERIKCPILLIRAKDSWHLSKNTAKKMVSTVKYCTYAEISGSDHMVYADNPGDFYPMLNDFLLNIG